MSHQPSPEQKYVLGNHPEELARLDRQAANIERPTRLLLQAAGLTSGMRVLDLGTGLGHVARIAGELVGPTGSVLGIDQSADAIGVARQRTQESGAGHVTFAEADVHAWRAPEPLDVVIGRLVLFHVPDPIAVVAHHLRNLRSGGEFIAIDFDLGGIRTEPPLPLFTEAAGWVQDAFRAAGAWPRIGARLGTILERGGLTRVTTFGVQGYLSPLDPAGPALLAGVVRSLVPAILGHGIATAEQMDLPTLEQRLGDALREADAVMLPPVVVGARSAHGVVRPDHAAPTRPRSHARMRAEESPVSRVSAWDAGYDPRHLTMPLTTSLARAAFSLVVAFVLTLVASSSAHAQELQSPDAKADGLVGRVHTVTGERYMARRTNGRLEEEGRHRPIAASTYDMSGHVERRDLVDDYGAPAGQETFTYELGRLLEAIVRDTTGAIAERRQPRYGAGIAAEQLTVGDDKGDGYVEKYVHSGDGRLDAIVYLVGSEEMGRSLFTYGAGQDPSEIAFVSADGEAATAPLGPCLNGHRIAFTYAEGRVAERTLYRIDGSLKQRTVFGYDPAGNVISELRSTSFDMDRLTHTYEFDAAGNWTRRVSAMEYDVKPDEPPRNNALLNITSRQLTYY